MYPNGGIEYPDLEKIWIAFGISFLCVNDAEIRLMCNFYKLGMKHLQFSWNWRHGKRNIWRFLKIFESRFRQHVRILISEACRRKNIRRQKLSIGWLRKPWAAEAVASAQWDTMERVPHFPEAWGTGASRSTKLKFWRSRFRMKLHQNTFGDRVPPGPDGELSAHQTLIGRRPPRRPHI